MIARIEIEGYELRKRFTEDPAYHARVREVLPQIPEKPDEWFSVDMVVDLAEFLPVLAELGIEPKIKAFKNSMFIGIEKKIEHLETQQKLLRQQMAIDGHIVQIHVPNAGLYLCDEVKICEDYCTNSLQDELNEGWRILCVCPPNGQRRPDYILGRRK